MKIQLCIITGARILSLSMGTNYCIWKIRQKKKNLLMARKCTIYVTKCNLGQIKCKKILLASSLHQGSVWDGLGICVGAPWFSSLASDVKSFCVFFTVGLISLYNMLFSQPTYAPFLHGKYVYPMFPLFFFGVTVHGSCCRSQGCPKCIRSV